MAIDWQAPGSGFDRRAYLAGQRRDHGRKAVALLPGDVPHEILTALDLIAVEVWAPPVRELAGAGQGLPSYVCSVARHALQFFRTGGAEAVDAVIVASTCDSLKGLGSLLAELAPLPCPVLSFDPGRASRGATGELRQDGPRPAPDPFQRAELDQLIHACEAVAGRRLETARLEQALRAHAEAEQLGRELYRRRASLVLGERRVLELLRAAEYLHVEDLLEVLRQALAHVESQPARPGAEDRVPVLLTGLVPEPMELLDLIEEAGLRVAADDLLCLGRRWHPPLPAGAGGLGESGRAGRDPTPPGGGATGGAEAGAGAGAGAGRRIRVRTSPVPASAPDLQANPLELLLPRMSALPPAPTRGPGRAGREDWLLAEAHRCGARGVIGLVVKFCEPELFELPARQQALAGARLPLVVVEHELGVPPDGAVATRLEAFCEMLR